MKGWKWGERVKEVENGEWPKEKGTLQVRWRVGGRENRCTIQKKRRKEKHKKKKRRKA